MRKINCATLLFSILLICAKAVAETYWSDPITSNTTWDINGSPYIVTDVVEIGGNSTLTIEPGVLVRVGAGKWIQLGISGSSSYAGHLVANGVTFERSDPNQPWYAIHLSHPYSSSVELTGCTIQGATYGIRLSRGSATLDGCTFRNNEWPFWHIGGTFDVNNLTVTDNIHQAVMAKGNIYDNPVWSTVLGLPYEVADVMEIGCTLTIESGVVVRVAASKWIQIGINGSSYDGHLIADGVTFERSDPNQPWYAIHLSHPSSSSIELTNCTVQGATYGIRLSKGTAAVEGCVLADGEIGVYVSSTISGNTSATCRQCSFVGQTSYGVSNLSPDVVDARWCYWGDPNGPSGEGPGQGVAVSDNVLYEPWLEEPPELVTVTPDLYDISNTRKVWEQEILSGRKLTGLGTMIGVVEAGGLPDTIHPTLKEKSPAYSNPDYHATAVTSIALGYSTGAVTSLADIEDARGQVLVESGKLMIFKGVAYKGEFVARQCDHIWWLTDCLDALIDEGAQLVNMSGGISTTRSKSDPSVAEAGEDVADYYVETEGLPLVVSAGNESSRTGVIKEIGNVTSPSGAFNTISVGAINNSNPNYPVLDSSSSGVEYNSNLGSNGRWRCKPDIVAPGYHIYCAHQGTNQIAWNTGTSIAAPQVSGAVAILLQALEDANSSQDPQYAILEDGSDPRVIKSVLLTSATKLPGFREPFWAYQEDTDPCDAILFEYDREYPLDLQQGAGLVNVSGALGQLLAGKHGQGTVPWRGWDLDVIPDNSSFHVYYLNDVPSGSKVVATLVWYRHLVRWPLWYEIKPLSNLDLVLFEGAVGISRSESTIDNVEHIYATANAGGSYTLMVDGVEIYPAEGEIYAIAWNVIPPHTLAGDVTLNGKIDLIDLSELASQWLQVEPPVLSADIINDGIVDLKDFAKLAGEWFQAEAWYEEP